MFLVDGFDDIEGLVVLLVLAAGGGAAIGAAVGVAENGSERGSEFLLEVVDLELEFLLARD